MSRPAARTDLSNGSKSFELVDTTTRSDWLTARRTGIGSSDIAGIVGLSPWTTPFQVWASKVSEIPEDTDSEAIRWGTLLESTILDAWAEDHRPVVDRGYLIRSTEQPWMIATPDGHTTTPDGDKAIAEAKNSAEYTWSEIPPHYVCQVQWQLAVSGYTVGYLIVLHSGRHLETYEIAADATYQAQLIDAATSFWELVEANEPPPVEAEDNVILASLYPRHIEQPVEITAEMAQELYDARAAHKEATKRRDAAEAAIKAALGEADTATYGQSVVATWRTSERSTIDVKRLRDEHSDLAAGYSTTTTTRRFLVKGDSL